MPSSVRQTIKELLLLVMVALLAALLLPPCLRCLGRHDNFECPYLLSKYQRHRAMLP